MSISIGGGGVAVGGGGGISVGAGVSSAGGGSSLSIGGGESGGSSIAAFVEALSALDIPIRNDYQIMPTFQNEAASTFPLSTSGQQDSCLC